MSAALRVGPGGLGFIKANSDAQPAVRLRLHADADATDGVVWTFPTSLPDEGQAQYLRVSADGEISYGTPASAAWTLTDDSNLAYVPPDGGAVLVGTESTDAPGVYQLEVEGSARFGKVVAPQLVAQSDRRLKTHICPIAPAEAVRRLQMLVGVDYVMRATGEKASGLIAQNVQEAQPWSVSPLDGTGGGFLGVQYNDVTGLLVAGVNALLSCVDALQTEAGALQQRIASLEAGRAGAAP